MGTLVLRKKSRVLSGAVGLAGQRRAAVKGTTSEDRITSPSRAARHQSSKSVSPRYQATCVLSSVTRVSSFTASTALTSSGSAHLLAISSLGMVFRVATTANDLPSAAVKVISYNGGPGRRRPPLSGLQRFSSTGKKDSTNSSLQRRRPLPGRPRRRPARVGVGNDILKGGFGRRPARRRRRPRHLFGNDGHRPTYGRARPDFPRRRPRLIQNPRRGAGRR